jgi:peptide/nickel transport system ATP-binding protein
LNNLLEVSNLKVSFATDAGANIAVDGVSFGLAAGKVLAVVGESGSGKSVTSKTILRMLPDTATTEGVVVISGSNVSAFSKQELRKARGELASMIFQEPATALNPVFPIGWQITQAIRSHEIEGKRPSKKQAKEMAIEMLSRVGIPNPEERFSYYPHQFSGGQKQRILIAAALALKPKLIIADEPTTALDVTVQAEILDLLRSFKEELGISILLITHNMGVVADLADDVVVMLKGQIVETGSVRDVFYRPTNHYTKKLLAAVPKILPATPKDTPRPNSAVMVSAKKLNVYYPGRLNTPAFHAIKDLDLEIRAGEVIGLVGESGSGKTTIGRAIAGLTRAKSGSLEVLGHEMVGFSEKEFKPLRKKIGFVFQDPASSFNPLLTIGDCIAEPMAIHTNQTRKENLSHVLELLDAVQLPKEFADRFPHELSGGQRQRASLARALALSPELVIADEPTSALDVSVQATVLELFAQLQKEFNFAAVFITHDLAVVNQVADRVVVLKKSELVEEGSVSMVMHDPKHPYTKRLLASHPYPDPDLQAKHREDLRKISQLDN